MMLSEFLKQIFDTGHVVVGTPRSDADIDEVQAVEVLLETELTWRQQLPSGLPVFDTSVALWSAAVVYRATQLLVHRELAEGAVRSFVAPRSTRPTTACEHYSADLCFRFMKDILRLGKALSASDPLNVQIQLLMKDWPLSSVGLPFASQAPVVNLSVDEPVVKRDESVTEQSVVWMHPALRIMYLDRIQKLGVSGTMQVDHVVSELRLWEQAVGQR